MNYLNFDQLEWHDSHVYAWGIIRENNALLIDVDWVKMKQEENVFSFYISPCTLIFTNVWDIEMNITMNIDLIIDKIEILSIQIPRNISVLPQDSKEYTFNIEFMEGYLTFKAIDLSIVQRKEEIKKSTDHLKYAERGGISLSTDGYRYKVNI